VGTFIQNRKVIDPSLPTEAITALGRMEKQLTWTSYHALVQRYLKMTRGSSLTARPAPAIGAVHLRDMIDNIRSQLAALSDGQRLVRDRLNQLKEEQEPLVSRWVSLHAELNANPAYAGFNSQSTGSSSAYKIRNSFFGAFDYQYHRQ